MAKIQFFIINIFLYTHTHTHTIFIITITNLAKKYLKIVDQNIYFKNMFYYYYNTLYKLLYISLQKH